MVREAVEFTYTDIPVLKVEHVWNSFLWGHYAQNAKVLATFIVLVLAATAAIAAAVAATRAGCCVRVAVWRGIGGVLLTRMRRWRGYCTFFLCYFL